MAIMPRMGSPVCAGLPWRPIDMREKPAIQRLRRLLLTAFACQVFAGMEIGEGRAQVTQPGDARPRVTPPRRFDVTAEAACCRRVPESPDTTRCGRPRGWAVPAWSIPR